MAKMKWKSKGDLLEELKESKISELSTSCTEDILHGFHTKIDGEVYRVSYDRESQANLQERWALFENEVIQEIKMTVHDEDTNEALRVSINKKQFEAIYLDSVKAKEDKISRLRDVLIPMVERAINEKEIELIKWSNQVNSPEEPSVVLSKDNTLGVKVQKVDQRLNTTNQNVSLTNAGLLEIAMLTMGL